MTPRPNECSKEMRPKYEADSGGDKQTLRKRGMGD